MELLMNYVVNTVCAHPQTPPRGGCGGGPPHHIVGRTLGTGALFLERTMTGGESRCLLMQTSARAARRRFPSVLAALIFSAAAAFVVLCVQVAGGAGFAPALLLGGHWALPVPLQPYANEESHIAFCERNGCSNFAERRRRDDEVYWQDSTHNQLSAPFQDVSPLTEFECLRQGSKPTEHGDEQQAVRTLMFAQSETAAQGLARAIGFTGSVESAGDAELGTALLDGLDALRREWETAVAANLCVEQDPVLRQSSCWTQTPANEMKNGDPFVQGCERLSPRCIKKKGYGSYDDLENLKYVLDCPALDVRCMSKNVLHEIHRGYYHGGSALGRGYLTPEGVLMHIDDDSSQAEYGSVSNDYDYANNGKTLEDFVSSDGPPLRI